MEDNQSNRIKDIKNSKDATVQLVDCSFSWGFRIKEDQNLKETAK